MNEGINPSDKLVGIPENREEYELKMRLLMWSLMQGRALVGNYCYLLGSNSNAVVILPDYIRREKTVYSAGLYPAEKISHIYSVVTGTGFKKLYIEKPAYAYKRELIKDAEKTNDIITGDEYYLHDLFTKAYSERLVPPTNKKEKDDIAIKQGFFSSPDSEYLQLGSLKAAPTRFGSTQSSVFYIAHDDGSTFKEALSLNIERSCPQQDRGFIVGPFDQFMEGINTQLHQVQSSHAV